MRRTRRLPTILGVSSRVYDFLLGLLPAEYRHRYGAPMAQAFRDLCGDAYRRGGAREVWRAWPRAFRDVCATAAAERLAALRAAAPGLPVAGALLLVILVAAMVVPALGLEAPPRSGTVALTPTWAYGNAGQPTVGAGSGRRPVLRLQGLDPERFAIAMGTGKPGRPRVTLYGSDGRMVRLEGTQGGRLRFVADGSMVISR